MRAGVGNGRAASATQATAPSTLVAFTPRIGTHGSSTTARSPWASVFSIAATTDVAFAQITCGSGPKRTTVGIWQARVENNRQAIEANSMVKPSSPMRPLFIFVHRMNQVLLWPLTSTSAHRSSPWSDNGRPGGTSLSEIAANRLSQEVLAL